MTESLPDNCDLLMISLFEISQSKISENIAFLINGNLRKGKLRKGIFERAYMNWHYRKSILMKDISERAFLKGILMKGIKRKGISEGQKGKGHEAHCA